MSASRMQRALRDLERRGLVERIELPGQPSEYRRPTPEVNLAPHAEALRTPVPRTGRAGTTYRGTPVPRTDKGLALEGLPLKEEKNSDERTVRGASPVASPPAERAHPSKELDIDQEPARVPLAPDAIDLDPRLHPEHALMDRMNGKPTAIQEERDARSFFVRLLGAANAKNPQVQPRMRAWHQQYGEEYITSVWHEATTAQDPRNARKSPLYYLVDALEGRFFPRAASAKRDAASAAPELEPGMLVMLPNGEQHILDSNGGAWSYLEGVPGVVRTADLRPVQEVRP